MNKIGNKIFCVITLIVAHALATEVAVQGPPSPPSAPDCPPSEIKCIDPTVKVKVTLTADNNFNFFIGNKLRATKFITASDNWKN